MDWSYFQLSFQLVMTMLSLVVLHKCRKTVLRYTENIG